MENREQSIWVDNSGGNSNGESWAEGSNSAVQRSQTAGTGPRDSGGSAANGNTVGVNAGTPERNAGTAGANGGTAGMNNGNMAGANGGMAGMNNGNMTGANGGTAGMNNGNMAGANGGTAGMNGSTAGINGGMAGMNRGPAGVNGRAVGMGVPPAYMPPVYTAAQKKPPVPDTEETKRFKENYGRIAPAALVFAIFYAFCMYKNASGITFPFFVGSSLLFLHFTSSKLGITLKKGSSYYMIAMLLLGISTFCTDDGRIIFFNKLGIFLLMMSLLLKQYFDTSKWQLWNYLSGICVLVTVSFGELGRPFSDGAAYAKSRERKPDKRFWYIGLGLLIGIPLLLVVLLLLASADAVFRQMTKELLENISLAAIFNVLLRIAFIFFASYALTAYLCKRRIREEVTDKRKGEPVLAITVTGLLTVLYLLFSGIQIMGLFLGQLQLPKGYTYAMYAREGFFQLLFVSFLNLVIVLLCLCFFRESKVLKGVLAVMSACTFVMIASSAMRMIIYIQYYYLTFLRIMVLWTLALLAALFAGVAVNIYKENFPLFRYSVAVVAVLYLALSFAHPDYIIAKVNVANALHGGVRQESSFFLASEPYQDFDYLRGLSADAAPVLVPYMEELGYHLEAFYEENPVSYALEIGEIETRYSARSSQVGFGYYWMARLRNRTENFGLRTFNVSRYRALRGFRE